MQSTRYGILVLVRLQDQTFFPRTLVQCCHALGKGTKQCLRKKISFRSRVTSICYELFSATPDKVEHGRNCTRICRNFANPRPSSSVPNKLCGPGCRIDDSCGESLRSKCSDADSRLCCLESGHRSSRVGEPALLELTRQSHHQRHKLSSTRHRCIAPTPQLHRTFNSTFFLSFQFFRLITHFKRVAPPEPSKIYKNIYVLKTPLAIFRTRNRPPCSTNRHSTSTSLQFRKYNAFNIYRLQGLQRHFLSTHSHTQKQYKPMGNHVDRDPGIKQASQLRMI